MIANNPVVQKLDGLLKPFMGDAPEPARIIGAAGVIPFVFFAILSLLLGGWTDRALLTWGALILAGLGMIRFGFAVTGTSENATWRALGLAVAPTLYAWVIINLLPVALGMLAMGVGFAVLYALDLRLTARDGAPAWWSRYRLTLSICAAASMIIGVF